MNVRTSAIGCVIAAALAATSASAATPPQPVPPIAVNPGGPNMPATTATLSNAKVGAKPVALTVKLHYEMVCGNPGQSKVVVTLPSAAFVPARMDGTAVLVNGKPAPAVDVSGHDVAVTMPPRPKGVQCMVVGPGTLTMTLTRAAGLGNPKSAGTYTVRVRRNTSTFRADIEISA